MQVKRASSSSSGRARDESSSLCSLPFSSAANLDGGQIIPVTKSQISARAPLATEGLLVSRRLTISEIFQRKDRCGPLFFSPQGP